MLQLWQIPEKRMAITLLQNGIFLTNFFIHGNLYFRHGKFLYNSMINLPISPGNSEVFSRSVFFLANENDHSFHNRSLGLPPEGTLDL